MERKEKGKGMVKKRMAGVKRGKEVGGRGRRKGGRIPDELHPLSVGCAHYAMS